MDLDKLLKILHAGVDPEFGKGMHFVEKVEDQKKMEKQDG